MKRAIAALVILVALGLGAAGANARPAYRYPASFERSFIASCRTTSNGRVAACRCALQWIERRYSYARLVTIARTDPRRMVRIVLASVRACR